MMCRVIAAMLARGVQEAEGVAANLDHQAALAAAAGAYLGHPVAL